MRARIISLVLLLTSIIACSDSPTAPKEVAVIKKSQVAVMQISIDTTSDFLVNFISTRESPDTTKFNTHTSLFSGATTNFIVNAGEKVYFGPVIGGAMFIWSNGTTPSTYEIFSDWQGVNPSNHKGISYDQASTIVFQTGALWDNRAGGKYPDFIPPSTFTSIKGSGGNEHITLKLPIVSTDVLQFAFAYQLRGISCLENDELVLSSFTGMSTVRSDALVTRNVDYSIKVPKVTVRCSIFSSMQAARASLKE